MAETRVSSQWIHAGYTADFGDLGRIKSNIKTCRKKRAIVLVVAVI